MELTEPPFRTAATVAAVEDAVPNEPIARRLGDLGFVAGEQVEVIAAGPVGAEPLLVQIGYTRFALRRREADRIGVRLPQAAEAPARRAAPAEVERA